MRLGIAPDAGGADAGIAALAMQVAIGAVLYWVMLRVLMPGAAAIIERLVLALARRDLGAMRASFGSFSG